MVRGRSRARVEPDAELSAADALAVAICHALAPPPCGRPDDLAPTWHARGRTPDGFVLDVHGVGYLPGRDPRRVRAAERGGEVAVETYLHVREDALQLYGFGDGAERQLFLHLLTVAGIGPKVALAIVSGSPAGEPAARSRSRTRRASRRFSASARRPRSESCSS